MRTTLKPFAGDKGDGKANDGVESTDQAGFRKKLISSNKDNADKDAFQKTGDATTKKGKY